MKYLLDKIARGGSTWRVIADTKNPHVWVIDMENVYEFNSRAEAYNFVVGMYRQAADMRNMQPGQSYNLTMADGSTKNVQVQNNTPQGVTILDPNSGTTMTIPHVQQGAEPKPAQPQKPQPGSQMGAPTPTPNDGVSPENRTYALGADDLKKTGYGVGREPYHCKHDRAYLLRKSPSDPEKFCPECGMVYVGSATKCEAPVKTSSGTAPCGNKQPCRVHNYTPKKDYADRSAGCDSDYWDERDGCDCPIHKNRKAKIISDAEECVNCGGHGKLDEKGQCDKCQRRKTAIITGGPGSYHVKSEEGKNLGGPYKTHEQAEHRLKQVEYFKHKKSQAKDQFHLWKSENRLVRARDIIAQPFGGQQAMPSAEVTNEGDTLKQQMEEKGPADFAEDPESPNPQDKADPNAKRKLTPHEIIEEAESLIRNALVKGVKIGAADLQEYMSQYYNNNPNELMQGIALAWQKVQYEEQMGLQEGDPNAPQGKGFGPKVPTTPEEAAQMAPKNGPIQTHRLS
jgi:hypothetical protein